MQKKKLQQLLKVFTPDDTRIDFSNFDNEVKKLQESLKEKIQVKTLEDVNSVLETNRKKINFQPLLDAFETLKTNITDENNQVNGNLLQALDEKMSELSSKIELNNQTSTLGNETLKQQLAQEIETLNSEVAVLSARKIEIPDFGKQIRDTETKLKAIIEDAKRIDELQDEKEKEEIQKQFLSFDKQVQDLKKQMMKRGGGSMNRKVTFNGTDSLTKYTDINYKAGSNVTLTIANNNTTKMVDVTIAATGGSGGVIRSIATTTVSSTVGAVAATDYVVLANGGVQITLPDAVSNTNLYTIKNIGTSSVLVATTGGETIDGSTTLIMPVQYTSVDLISDSANWEIT